MSEDEQNDERLIWAQKKANNLKSFYKNIILFLFLLFCVIIVFNVVVPGFTEEWYYVIVLAWVLWLIYQGVNLADGIWIFSRKWEEKVIRKFLLKKEE